MSDRTYGLSALWSFVFTTVAFAGPPVEFRAPYFRIFFGGGDGAGPRLQVQAPFVDIQVGRGDTVVEEFAPGAAPAPGPSADAPDVSEPPLGARKPAADAPAVSEPPLGSGRSAPETLPPPKSRTPSTSSTSTPILPTNPPPAASPAPVAPSVPSPSVTPAWNLRDFARTFQPRPGWHEAVFTHPRTGQPVALRFYLPPGIVKEVNVDRDTIEFEYPRGEVELQFSRTGASVRYDGIRP